MRHASLLLAVIIFVTATPASIHADHVIDDSKNPQYLFVLSAKSGTLKDGKLTLKDVPLVIYFSDRPNRIAGHMSVEQFVKMWGEGKDSFKVDPPNAALSVFDRSGSKTAIVELSTPEVRDTAVVFIARTIKGPIPPTFCEGPCSSIR